MTPGQSRLLTFVREFIDTHGFAPSYEEMRLAMGLKSKSGVHAMVLHLVDQRRLRLTHSGTRNIEVVGHRPASTLAAQAEMLADSILRRLKADDHFAPDPDGDLYVASPEDLRGAIVAVLSEGQGA